MKHGLAVAALLGSVMALGMTGLGEVPAGAGEVVVHGRIGDVHVGLRTRDHHDRHSEGHHLPRRHLHRDRGDEPLLFGSGPVNDFARDQKKRALQQPQRFRHGGHHRRFVPRPFLVPYFVDPGDREDDDDGDERESRALPAPEAITPEPPLPPPDARGPEWEPARGRTFGPAHAVELGRRLPDGRPHVALDWRDYGLPRPPAGQSYARFEGAVLRIDSGTRVVREIVCAEGSSLAGAATDRQAGCGGITRNASGS